MNATIDEINSCFNNLMRIRGVYKLLYTGSDPIKRKRMYSLVNTTRERLRKGKMVTIDLKIRWLLKSDWRPGTKRVYTKDEVLKILTKAVRLNKQMKSMPAEFILEQIE